MYLGLSLNFSKRRQTVHVVTSLSLLTRWTDSLHSSKESYKCSLRSESEVTRVLRSLLVKVSIPNILSSPKDGQRLLHPISDERSGTKFVVSALLSVGGR